MRSGGKAGKDNGYLASVSRPPAEYRVMPRPRSTLLPLLATAPDLHWAQGHRFPLVAVLCASRADAALAAAILPCAACLRFHNTHPQAALALLGLSLPQNAYALDEAMRTVDSNADEAILDAAETSDAPLHRSGQEGQG